MTKKTLSPEEQKKIKERIQKALKEGRVAFAGDYKVEQYRKSIEILKVIVGTAAHLDLSHHCFVSDESMLGDFVHGSEEQQKRAVDEIGARLGFPVALTDYMWEIAMHMGPKH